MTNLATEDDTLKEIVKTQNCFMNCSFPALTQAQKKYFS